jgi:hypothetical protein
MIPFPDATLVDFGGIAGVAILALFEISESCFWEGRLLVDVTGEAALVVVTFTCSMGVGAGGGGGEVTLAIHNCVLVLLRER